MTITINGTTGIAGVDGSAATPSVQGADTNTGVFFPAADQVALSASGSQVVLVNALGSTITGTQSVSGNLSFNSGYGSAATAYGCRAWVNFDGTGTVAIRGSGNVSSITDNGVGDYTVNLTTAMPDTNFSVAISRNCTGNNQNADIGEKCLNNIQTAPVRTTSTFSILSQGNATATPIDSASVNAHVFR